MTDDQKAISDVVGSVADYSGNVARLRELFTRDAAPSATDGKKYGDYMYNVEGTINVSGDTATFDVSIVPSADENPTPVKKTWKAVKEGGKWKLSEAPLP